MTADEFERLLDEFASECVRHNEYDNTRNVAAARAAIIAAWEGIAQDSERWCWYMSNTPKPPDCINAYMRGIRERWELWQWNAWADAAIAQADGGEG